MVPFGEESFDQSMVRVGSICSILAGILFVISGLLFGVSQFGRFDWSSIASIAQFLDSGALASKAWLAINWSASLASFLAIGGVLAISDVMRPVNSGLVRWLSTLAIIGYLVISVTNVADYYQVIRLASGYHQLDPSAQDAVNLIGVSSLDPNLNLRFVTLSPWFFTIGWLTLKSNRLPGFIGYLGVAAGIGGTLTFIASLFEAELIVLIAAVLAIVLHPIWLLGTGHHLWVLGQEHSV